MKKIFTLISLMFLSISAFSQALIITDTDMPIPSAPYNIDEITLTSPVAPHLGDNILWDYSSNFGNTPLINDYHVETDAFFTSAGIDVNLEGTKTLTATLGYYVINEYDFNTAGVYEAGVNINQQGYELSAFTGSTSDSLNIPAQQYIFTDTKTLIEFPFTRNSSWSSVSRRTTDFNLTVASYFLNHTPGQHAYTYYRNDSIVGWGKMSVYTTSGPSIQYDVLMERVEQYALDSFYLSGSPAPAPLLTAFMVTQGQHSNEQYSYNFYRAGSFNYLMRFFYGSDNTYSNLTSAFVNTDNLTYTNNLKDVSYSTLVFPNPANGNEINVKVMGSSFELNKYSISDQLGNTVQEGTLENHSGGIAQISFNHEIANGIYYINAKDKFGREVVKEKINLQR